MKVVLEKYHGLGNDYLVFDPNKNTLKLSQENVKLICDRHFDVGSDGIPGGPILGEGKVEVRIWNSDGSTAERSGNGVRIFARYLKDAGYIQKTYVTLPTLAGDVDVQYLNGEGTRMKASVDKVSFWNNETPVNGEQREIVNETIIFERIPYRVTCATIGSPHCVIFLNEISKDIVCRVGKDPENTSYFPERVNTQTMRVVDRRSAEIEVYERDAGYTLTSGSNGCVAVATVYKQGLTDSKMYVKMPGRTLEIGIFDDWTVLMTGDVGFVGTMQLDNTLVGRLRALE